MVDRDLEDSEADGALEVPAAFVVAALCFGDRLCVETKPTKECLDFVLANTVFAKAFCAFETQIHLFVSILAATRAHVMHVR